MPWDIFMTVCVCVCVCVRFASRACHGSLGVVRHWLRPPARNAAKCDGLRPGLWCITCWAVVVSVVGSTWAGDTLVGTVIYIYIYIYVCLRSASALVPCGMLWGGALRFPSM